MKVIPEPAVFEWDTGNIDKNFAKHGVTNKEIESVFSCQYKYTFFDERHSSETEKRYMLWGVTNDNTGLSIIFTRRKDLVRVISARSMNRKERRAYEKKVKADTQI